eukprot:TRINITY_DN2507_c1_g1_i1.p1 TRINITY_DN2507_c1_g1~~TRINITY_DN2507_c1_g1_i1.p1  ORF type:complete len:1143 (+),score=463.90 TRINITY_DN2507_c1_g1_i1:59-3487(+)
MAQHRMSGGGPRRHEGGKENVHVFVRPRPLECKGPAGPFRLDSSSVTYRGGATGVRRGDHKYEFERVFETDVSQADVFSAACEPLVDAVLAGYSCTLCAYGQTASGKTHTMMGANGYPKDESRGLIPRAAELLFGSIERDEQKPSVRLSCAELYMESFYDMLSTEAEPQPLRLLQDGQKRLVVRGITEHSVHNVAEMMEKLNTAAHRRRTSATGMNDRSSRSHMIVTITVTRKIEEDVRAQVGEEKRDSFRVGKFHMVDLAGSESAKRAETTGKGKQQQQREASSINRSLLTLGKVIMSLSEPGGGCGRIPYRDSALTRFLEDALGGKAITHIIATLSLAHSNTDETLSTLEYASTAKKIENEPTVNKQVCGASMIHEIQGELAMLREQLRTQRSGDGVVKVLPEEWASLQQRLQELRDGCASQGEKIAELTAEVSTLQGQCESLTASGRRKNKLLQRHQDTEVGMVREIDQFVDRERRLASAIVQRDAETVHNDGVLSELRRRVEAGAGGVKRAASEGQDELRGRLQRMASDADDAERLCGASAAAALAGAEAAEEGHTAAAAATSKYVLDSCTAVVKRMRLSGEADERAAADADRMSLDLSDQTAAALATTAAAAATPLADVAAQHRAAAAATARAVSSATAAAAARVSAASDSGFTTLLSAAAKAAADRGQHVSSTLSTVLRSDAQQSAACKAACAELAAETQAADEVMMDAVECNKGATAELTRRHDALTEQVTSLRERHTEVRECVEAHRREWAQVEAMYRHEMCGVDSWKNSAISLVIESASEMQRQVEKRRQDAAELFAERAAALGERSRSVEAELQRLLPGLAAANTMLAEVSGAMHTACQRRMAAAAASGAAVQRFGETDSAMHAGRRAALDSFSSAALRTEEAAAATMEKLRAAAVGAVGAAASGCSDAVAGTITELHGQAAAAVDGAIAQVHGALKGAAAAETDRLAELAAAAAAAALERATVAAGRRAEAVEEVEAIPADAAERSAPITAKASDAAAEAAEHMRQLTLQLADRTAAAKAAADAADAAAAAKVCALQQTAADLCDAARAAAADWTQHVSGQTPERSVGRRAALTAYAPSPGTPPAATPQPRRTESLTPSFRAPLGSIATNAMTPPQRQKLAPPPLVDTADL